MGLIYKLSFDGGKHYIGQTVKTLRARLNQHKQAVQAGSLLAVHCAWRAHGAPDVVVLGEYADGDNLHTAEVAAIAEHGTLAPAGYNITTGGDTAPSKAPEVAAKIAAKAKGRKASAKTLSVLSDATRALWESPEYRAKVKAGVVSAITDEYRAKLSAAQKARWERQKASGWCVSEFARQKMRNKVFSEETRKRMSESAKVRIREPRSEETCAKIANAQRAFAAANPEALKQRGAAISAALQAKREKLQEAARKRWADPAYRARVMAAKAATKDQP